MSQRKYKLKNKLKLRLRKMAEHQNMDTEIQSGQGDLVRPSFLSGEDEGTTSKDKNDNNPVLEELKNLMEVKHNLNTIQEGINLAKSTNILPPYLEVTVRFTPRMIEHSSKDNIKEDVRAINKNLRTMTLQNISASLAKQVREVALQMENIIEKADIALNSNQEFEERRILFAKCEELKKEYSEKLAKYKEALMKKPGVTKPKDKFRKK